MSTITLYRTDSTAPVIFKDVKSFFWTADNTVLVIAIWDEDAKTTGKHHYVHWLRERVTWFRHRKDELGE